MHKKFEIHRTKIKGGCQSGRKVVPHDSKTDLPLSKYLRQHGVCYVSVVSIYLVHILTFRFNNSILKKTVACR